MAEQERKQRTWDMVLDGFPLRVMALEDDGLDASIAHVYSEDRLVCSVYPFFHILDNITQEMAGEVIAEWIAHYGIDLAKVSEQK